MKPSLQSNMQVARTKTRHNNLGAASATAPL